jgi:GTP diphosphokinase / guanosine-3',5'-bis(diphosphate) 3'-diphosphatase
MSTKVGSPAAKGTALVLKAAAFAAWTHRDQRRKDAEASPYIREDTETTVEELTGAFGRRVAGIVEEVTDTD